MNTRRGLSRLCALLVLCSLVLCTDASVAQTDRFVARRLAVDDLIREQKYAPAEAQAKEWLELAERSSGARSLDAADALEALTKIYAGLRRYRDAENFWRRCAEIRVAAVGNKHALISKTIDLMTGILIDQGRSAEAQALWRDGLEAFRTRPPVAALENASPPPPDVSARRVPDLIARGQFQDAEAALRRGGDRAALAVFLIERGRHAEAIDVHRQLLDLAPTGERAINIAALYRQRALAAPEQEFLQRAVTLQERDVGPEHADLMTTLTALGASFEKEGNHAKAYAAFKRAASIAAAMRSKHSFTAPLTATLSLRQPYLNFLRVASRLASGRSTQSDDIAAETFETGQLLTETALNYTLSQLGVRSSKGSGPLAQLIRRRQDLEREWQGLDTQLIAAVTGAGPAERSTQKEALRTRLRSVESQLATVDGQIRRAFPQYFDFALPAPLTVQAARGSLRDDEALMQFALIGEQAYAWLVTKAQTKWVRLPYSPERIETMVAALRCGLDYPRAWSGTRCSTLVGRAYRQADHAALKPLPFDLSLAHQLYAGLFSQFEEAVAHKHLLIVASGPLSSLPLHVLVSQAPAVAIPNDWIGYARASWLAKSHTITMLPSVTSLKTLRTQAGQSTATKPYIAFANPLVQGASGTDRSAFRKPSCQSAEAALSRTAARQVSRAPVARYFEGGAADVHAVRKMEPLPETADEVCAVARQLGASDTDVFLAERAKESALKSLSAAGTLETYRVVHFATHGLLAGETEIQGGGRPEAALVLTPPGTATPEDDGLLAASEIAQLRLNAEWVILSACNTAGIDKSDVEALAGLSRAFFYAGTRALLVSHWAVDSAATVILVTKTVEGLTRQPSIGRAQALREAMLGMISAGDDPSAHPAYWAPFVLLGEGAAQ